jgi:hypothetical protein
MIGRTGATPDVAATSSWCRSSSQGDATESPSRSLPRCLWSRAVRCRPRRRPDRLAVARQAAAWCVGGTVQLGRLGVRGRGDNIAKPAVAPAAVAERNRASLFMRNRLAAQCCFKVEDAERPRVTRRRRFAMASSAGPVGISPAPFCSGGSILLRWRRWRPAHRIGTDLRPDLFQGFDARREEIAIAVEDVVELSQQGCGLLIGQVGRVICPRTWDVEECRAEWVRVATPASSANSLYIQGRFPCRLGRLLHILLHAGHRSLGPFP